MTITRSMKTALLLILGGATGLLVWRLQTERVPDGVPPPAKMVASAKPAERASGEPLAQAASVAALPGKNGQTEAPARLRERGPRDESPAELLARVQLALSNGTPEQALDAALSMEGCVQVMKGVELITAAGLRGIRPEDVKPMLGAKEAKIFESMGLTDAKRAAGHAEFERTVRRCQALDAITLAQSGELFARAYKGGALGAAGEYLSSLTTLNPTSKADPALLDRLRAEVRQEANAGQFSTLVSFANMSRSMAWGEGFSAVEHWAYREAYYLIIEHNQPGSSAEQRAWTAGMEQASPPGVPPTAPLTEQQKAEAIALANQIVAAHLKPRLTAVHSGSP